MKEAWLAEMGWRYVSYTENQITLTFQIEPMVQGPDIVYVPPAKKWQTLVPDWAREKYTEILGRVKSIKWKRPLSWSETEAAELMIGIHKPIPGTIESTSGGQKLESMRLFNADGPVSPEEARTVWYSAVKKFTEQVVGEVNVFANQSRPGSVFEQIELPVLKSNQKVNVVFHSY